MGQATLQFGHFKLDPAGFALSRADRSIKLERKPMELLILLAERQGQLVGRDEIARHLWGAEVFVDTEHGINTAVRKLRQALGDDPEQPQFVQTVTGKGYRFLAPIFRTETPAAPTAIASTRNDEALIEPAFESRSTRWKWIMWVAAGIVGASSLGVWLGQHRRARPPEITYSQLTEFTDSAVSPSVSADGRMLAFIRGNDTFMSADPIYLKVLPHGEVRRLVDDGRVKYGLAFSPDDSELAYTVLDATGFSTWTVSTLGGDPHLLRRNAAGLRWLNSSQMLYSEIRTGIHLGLVTGSANSDDRRDVYFPAHERGMVHYSYPSPDHRQALLVEMNESGDWGPCRMVSLSGVAATQLVGPKGECTAAGWSGDGSWMYFVAAIDGQSHLWRQRYPDGLPEQLTFGPTDEQGLAVETASESLITSVGVHESELWFHDGSGDRSLSSEGEVLAGTSPPLFNHDGTTLYYLLRHAGGAAAELWRTSLTSGKSEVVLPGVFMVDYDVSPDDKQVIFTTYADRGSSRMWLASLERDASPILVGNGTGTRPHFAGKGQIVFQMAEGNANYLERMNLDGSRRQKLVPYSIAEIQGVSPGRHWVTAVIAAPPEGLRRGTIAIPLEGGSPSQLCVGYCVPGWSSDGTFLLVSVESATRSSPGRSIAIPLGSGETLPMFPAFGGAPGDLLKTLPGTKSIEHEYPILQRDTRQFAWVKQTEHRNLFRLSIH